MSKVISVIRNGKFVDFTVSNNAVVSATNEVVSGTLRKVHLCSSRWQKNRYS